MLELLIFADVDKIELVWTCPVKPLPRSVLERGVGLAPPTAGGAAAAATEAAWFAANAEGTIGVMPAGSPEPVMELGRLTWKKNPLN